MSHAQLFHVPHVMAVWCPHMIQHALRPQAKTDCRRIPNGVNGIEERLHVVWQEMVVPGEAKLGFQCALPTISWGCDRLLECACRSKSAQKRGDPADKAHGFRVLKKGFLKPNAGLISASKFVELVSTSTAQTFGIYPRKVTAPPGPPCTEPTTSVSGVNLPPYHGTPSLQTPTQPQGSQMCSQHPFWLKMCVSTLLCRGSLRWAQTPTSPSWTHVRSM